MHPLPGNISSVQDKKKRPFPRVIATANNRSANATEHAVTLPAGANIGDLLVVCFSVDANTTMTVNTTASGPYWQSLSRNSNGTVVAGQIFWKVANGAGTDALTITAGASEGTSHTSYLIYGGNTVTGNSINASGTNSNPPAHTPGDNLEYLFFVSRHGDSNVIPTVFPTNYTDNTLTMQGLNTNGVSTSSAYRYLMGSTDDPGTFTVATEQHVTYTFAVHPGNTRYAYPFTSGDWSITPGDTLLTINITNVPRFTTDIEYRVDGGSWTSSGGIVGFNITSLTNGVSYNVELRAVTIFGNSSGNDVKSGTPVEPGAAIDVSYIGTHTDETEETTNYNWAGISVGAADANRKMVVAFGLGAESALTLGNVTLGGVTMTQVALIESVLSGDVSMLMGIYICSLPTGTTATLDIAFSGASAFNVQAAVYRLVGASSTALDTATATVVPSSGSTSADVNTVDGGAVIGIATTFLNAGTTLHTWTGITEQLEQNPTGIISVSHGFHAAVSTESPRAVSCTHGFSGTPGTDGFAIATASFEPG